MNKKSIFSAMLVGLLALSFVFVSCDTDGGGGGGEYYLAMTENQVLALSLQGDKTSSQWLAILNAYTGPKTEKTFTSLDSLISFLLDGGLPSEFEAEVRTSLANVGDWWAIAANTTPYNVVYTERRN